MPNYQNYLMRHGEHGIQAIIEIIERNEGIRRNVIMTLEDRWNAVMKQAPVFPSPLAA